MKITQNTSNLSKNIKQVKDRNTYRRKSIKLLENVATNKSSKINNKEHNHSNQSKNIKEVKERIIDKIKLRKL